MTDTNNPKREIVPQGFPERLLSGYASFRTNRLRYERGRYEALAEAGQKPEILLISCCDSRSGPETIFDSHPGELFVVRNVANLVPPFNPDDDYHGTSAALEFAVQALKVKHIVVMGHGRCGGINAYLQHMEDPETAPLSPGNFIGKWISMLDEPAQSEAFKCHHDKPMDEKQRALEEVSIRHSIQNVRSFPCVNILQSRNQIQVHGAWFDISTGELWVLDEEKGKFIQPV